MITLLNINTLEIISIIIILVMVKKVTDKQKAEARKKIIKLASKKIKKLQKEVDKCNRKLGKHKKAKAPKKKQAPKKKAVAKPKPPPAKKAAPKPKPPPAKKASPKPKPPPAKKAAPKAKPPAPKKKKKIPKAVKIARKAKMDISKAKAKASAPAQQKLKETIRRRAGARTYRERGDFTRGPVRRITKFRMGIAGQDARRYFIAPATKKNFDTQQANFYERETFLGQDPSNPNLVPSAFRFRSSQGRVRLNNPEEVRLFVEGGFGAGFDNLSKKRLTKAERQKQVDAELRQYRGRIEEFKKGVKENPNIDYYKIGLQEAIESTPQVRTGMVKTGASELAFRKRRFGQYQTSKKQKKKQLAKQKAKRNKKFGFM